MKDKPILSWIGGGIAGVLLLLVMGAATPREVLTANQPYLNLSVNDRDILQTIYLSQLTGTATPSVTSLASPTQLAPVIPTDSDTPAKLSSTAIYTKKFVVKGVKAWQTNNTGTVYIGMDDTGGRNQFDLTAGSERTFEAPPGNVLNIAEYYVDSNTTGDGAAVFYY